MPIDITDPDDERVADYLALTDMALRRRLEPERGLYIAESSKVIRRAFDAGHRFRSLLMAPRWLPEMAADIERAERAGIPVYVAGPDLLAAITGFHVHRGALACVHRPELADPRHLLAGARRVLVMEDVVDHTNVGALMRSCAALGVDAVLVTPRCADPLYRRAVRVSMGTVFHVPWTRIDPWPGGIEILHDAGFSVAALGLGPGALALDDFVTRIPERLALVVGTEGDGLSRATLEGADVTVRIPMAGGVDSLNVAAACAVALWATRARSGPT